MEHFKKFWGVYLLAIVAIYFLFFNKSTKIFRAGGVIPFPGPVRPINPVIVNPVVPVVPVELRPCDRLDAFMYAYNSSLFPYNCSHSGLYRTNDVVLPSDSKELYSRCISRGASTSVCNDLIKRIGSITIVK